MSKYQIKWAEVSTTSTGKTKTTLTLIDEKGTETDKVTTWGDFPNFAELQPGKSVNGNISVKVNGQYTNKTLYPEPTAPAWATAGPTGKGGGIAKAQERKETGIAKTMDRKEEGIKISSTMRDAVNLAVAEQSPNEDRIMYWRKWLWDHWDDLIPPNLPF